MADKAKLVKSTDKVDIEILAAGAAAGSMYSHCKVAMTLAALELDTTQPDLKVRIGTVLTAHAAAFTTAGHNVRAICADILTLLACASDPVTVPGPEKGKTATATAKDAANLPKHAMKAAAKQVRDAHGIGRASGGGAKAKPVAPKRDAEAEFKDFLSEFGNYLKSGDAGIIKRIISLASVAGYVMAAKVKPTMEAKPTLESLPRQVVTT